MKNLIFFSFILFLAGCKPYGEKVEWKGKVLYYPLEYGKDKAQNLLSYLDEYRYFEDSITEICLSKDNNRWVLKIPIRKGTENDEEKLRSLKLRTTFLSELIPKPDFELTDDKFNTIKLIPNAIREIGKPFPEDEPVTLFVLPDVTDEEATKLHKSLVKMDSRNYTIENKGTVIVYQVEKIGGTFILGIQIKEALESDAMTAVAYQTLGVAISEKVFEGAKVDVRTMNDQFKTIRTYPYDDRYKPFVDYVARYL